MSTATEWTRKRIFSGTGRGTGVASPSSAGEYNDDESTKTGSISTSPPISGEASNMSVSIGSRGEALVTYPNKVQLWKYDASTEEYYLSGSTYDVEGMIISSCLVSREYQQEEVDLDQVILQISHRRNIVLEIHELGHDSYDAYSMVVPPSSSRDGPYQICSPDKCDYIGVVNSDGLITLFSKNDFHPIALSGLETRLNDGNALFDMNGRWLAFCPPKLPKFNHTPLQVPPSSPLYQRVIENLSSTAVSSLKTIADAGVSSIRNYLSPDTMKNSNNNHNSIINNYSYNYNNNNNNNNNNATTTRRLRL